MYIQVKNLSYTYNKDFPNEGKALENVSFEVEKKLSSWSYWTYGVR